MRKAIRQGEVILKPSNQSMIGAETATDFVAAHSNAGHHHIVKGKVSVLKVDGKTFIELDKPSKIVHLQTGNKHHDVPVPAGVMEVIRKTGRNPVTRVLVEIAD